ncbi:lamin-B receptor [Toxorhynchites rutilus septentrionalis]|uniref:lamin-B receptor n=1 Tax=Toxorhynchites rutilus septentrionalis TaxID=329112 RepID=UPI00247A9890|nr:lamin-B receptor [Toxorhynchites rutilus septentrionalis]
MESRRSTRGGGPIPSAAVISVPGPAETAKRGRKSTARNRSPSPPPARRPSPGRATRKASPARKSSPARKASPARKKSPARKASPVRKASPARKASPGRKTTRTTNTVVITKISPETKEEPRRSARIRTSEQRDKSPVIKKLLPDKVLSAILDETEEASQKASPAKSLTPNTSQRSAPTTERSRASASHSVSVANESQEFSDQEDVDYQSFRRDDNGIMGGDNKSYARRSTAKQLQELREFGGNLGALSLLLLVPTFVMFVNHFCSGAAHRDCTFKIPTNFDEFKMLSTYFNREVGAIFLLFSWGVAIFTALPIGKSVKIVDEIRGQQSYTFTGLSCAVFTGLAVSVAEYCYKYPLISTISKGYNQLLIISLVYALLTACLAFIKSRYVPQINWNPYAKSGRLLSDFLVGREINPLTFNIINLKLVHYHISVILALVFNCIIIYRNLHFSALPAEPELITLVEKVTFALKNLEFEVTPVFAASLTVLYLLDLLVYEHHLTFSFDLQGEGFGAMLLLRYAVFPFTVTLLPKYVAAHKLPEVPYWGLALMATVALIGLLIKRSSNRLKHQYRLNPLSEKFIDLDTLPTFQGRRLLVAKWWGRVRQPNYTGDILQNVALLPLLYWRFAWPPLLFTLFTVALLVHRARRVNDRNAKKYNSAWQRYSSMVRYMLVPKVF